MPNNSTAKSFAIVYNEASAREQCAIFLDGASHRAIFPLARARARAGIFQFINSRGQSNSAPRPSFFPSLNLVTARTRHRSYTHIAREPGARRRCSHVTLRSIAFRNYRHYGLRARVSSRFPSIRPPRGRRPLACSFVLKL